MRTNTTTYQRAIAQARKLQPETKQINNSLFFEVASTSVLDGWHRVTLGPNKFNPLLDSKCDCGVPARYLMCIHRVSAFLKYTANLEERLWKGCDYITEMQNQGATEEEVDQATDFWKELLDKYERNCDLIKAIDLGYDISTLTKAYKSELFKNEPTLLTA